MSKIKFNYSNRTIEVSEAFAKKASVYNSAAYNELKEIQQTYPNYTLKIVKSSSKAKSSLIKGINVEFMRKYIEKHNEDNYLEKFEEFVNKGLTFLAIKNNFIEKYPVFKNCKTKADWILVD